MHLLSLPLLRSNFTLRRGHIWICRTEEDFLLGSQADWLVFHPHGVTEDVIYLFVVAIKRLWRFYGKKILSSGPSNLSAQSNRERLHFVSGVSHMLMTHTTGIAFSSFCMRSSITILLYQNTSEPKLSLGTDSTDSSLPWCRFQWRVEQASGLCQ